MRGMKAKRGAGGDFSVSWRPPSGKESSRKGERRRESPGPSVEGEAEDGGGRGTAGEDGEEGGLLRMREKKTRGGEIRSLRVGSRPRMREEGKCLDKICSSTSRLEHCWDELWGGTNAVTKRRSPLSP